jgi:uracil-DNA glycosylase
VSCSRALDAFLSDQKGGGWAALPFFSIGAAKTLTARLDAMVASGSRILPPPADLFAALALTAPYPTPGDAHGLAFSVQVGTAIPRSLRNILKEMEADLGLPPQRAGSLLPWARQGVLLLNTCLTVTAGQAGAHRGLGWERLADEAIRHVSDRSPGAVFILWGADARKRRPLIDEEKHLVIATAHPSPLSARRGFTGSKPFSRSNSWLAERGLEPIDWRLEPAEMSGRPASTPLNSYVSPQRRPNATVPNRSPERRRP